MTLFKNTWNGFKYLKWSKTETICYLLRGIARETGIALPFFERQLLKAKRHTIMKFFDKKQCCFNFNGAKLPDISKNLENISGLKYVFDDVLLISCRYQENYSKKFVEFMDKKMVEGPYGYIDSAFDVTVKPGDVVIDAGAWIGDFSAYATSKGAVAYAFEPVKDTYEWLCKTKQLNNDNINGGQIYPVQKGLGNIEGEINISIQGSHSGGNSFVISQSDMSEKIIVTTLDKFAEENHLTKIDFIKADIEGAERDMLKGATNVLKTFAPKLAICTYHLPDDPEVLEKIILDANPNYKVVHLRQKLFAAVI